MKYPYLLLVRTMLVCTTVTSVALIVTKKNRPEITPDPPGWQAGNLPISLNSDKSSINNNEIKKESTGTQTRANSFNIIISAPITGGLSGRVLACHEGSLGLFPGRFFLTLF